MPSLEACRALSSLSGTTVGQALKIQSDMLMESEWDTGIGSKVCYLYDYFHDDQPEKKCHMSYFQTSKTRIDARFIVSRDQSYDKDQVEYYLMFRPSQKIEFEPEDDLYYYETDYRLRYMADFPIGLYVDIPDNKDVYRRWLVLGQEISNQFTKYLILPCNYRFMWIEQDGNRRIKRKMWGVLRDQSSYNSGIWRDYLFASVENQEKLCLPMNSISEKVFYTHEDTGKNMRMIVGTPTKHPSTWIVSKVENAKPFGIQKLTLYQDLFNPATDYVDLETGEMFADYHDASVDPEVVPDLVVGEICKITASTNVIKIGGSYRLITAAFYDVHNEDTTDRHSLTLENWTAEISQGTSWVECDTNLLITKIPDNTSNKIRVKFLGDRSYIGQKLKLTCKDKNTVGEILFEIIV